jgi:hypothetical protein
MEHTQHNSFKVFFSLGRIFSSILRYSFYWLLIIAVWLGIPGGGGTPNVALSTSSGSQAFLDNDVLLQTWRSISTAIQASLRASRVQPYFDSVLEFKESVPRSPPSSTLVKLSLFSSLIPPRVTDVSTS